MSVFFPGPRRLSLRNLVNQMSYDVTKNLRVVVVGGGGEVTEIFPCPLV